MQPLGPYTTTTDGGIGYTGNRLYDPQSRFTMAITKDELARRYTVLAQERQWGAMARIHDQIFRSTTRYFADLAALFVPLPLTTRMISSPGAMYGRYKLNYTTDTAPVTLEWFDVPNTAFLSESSQIYLELALVQQNVNHVFSVYNSFRKEESDITHLAEFHHVEYEGHVSAERNVQIAEELVRVILQDVVAEQTEALSVFLRPDQLRRLRDALDAPELFAHVTFEECLAALYEDTNNDRYQHFTLQWFGAWEEIRLTEIFGKSLAISGFPLYEVPFYHTIEPGSTPEQARNTDLIWSGYREVIGAGQRIKDIAELEAKAEAFQLPPADYAPYLRARRAPNFQQSSGFGLGWERLVQGLLCLPAIWLTCPFPRTHLDVVP
jgi:aspartyl/asparaginyl-tRNA synthetase